MWPFIPPQTPYSSKTLHHPHFMIIFSCLLYYVDSLWLFRWVPFHSQVLPFFAQCPDSVSQKSGVPVLRECGGRQAQGTNAVHGDMDAEPFGSPELGETLQVTWSTKLQICDFPSHPLSKVSSDSSFLPLMAAHSVLGSFEF